MPMTAFAELGLSDSALKAVERLGYEDPTPVQEQAIPLVLEGRDLIAAASTGTGKTAAFLLPGFTMLPPKPRGYKSRGRAPHMLVISPTRELAQQIARTAMKISRQTGHFVTTVFGGTPYGPQIRELRDGTDVLIATPGRLTDLMERGVVKLKDIQILVLDEADRMLDMGFLPDVTAIVEKTPAERQTLLFSATIDESIQNNLGSLLKDPAVVEVAPMGTTAESVAQFLIPTENADKPELLRDVLNEKGHERVIVFTRTKNRAEEFSQMLTEAGYSAESIHSDKNQGQRRRALAGFRKGTTDILVATDVLARGIDVTGVDYVVNVDLPDMPEDYIHRIGRTGRAGEKGFAISFATRETRRTLEEIEKLIGRPIPFLELKGMEIDPTLLEPKSKGKGKGGKRGGGSRSEKSGSARSRKLNAAGRKPSWSEDEGEGKQPARKGGANSHREDGKHTGRKAGTSRYSQKPGGKRQGKEAHSGSQKKRPGSGGFDYSKFNKRK